MSTARAPTDPAERLALAETLLRQEFERDRNAADVFVISCPKAGRTWHRTMLGHYLTQICHRPPADSLKLDELCAAAGVKRVVYSHNGANLQIALPAEHELIASPDLWRDREVLLLVRDPRDVLVSAYHHAAFRGRRVAGSISDFIRHSHVGLDKILTAYNRWHDNRHLAVRFNVTSYEQMHASPHAALAQVLRLAGATIDDARVAITVDSCRFDEMRRLEDEQFFDSGRMRNRTDDPRANKVRAGKIGGFRDHLSDGDLEWIAARTAQLGDPFRPLYANP